jgi:hypothetical protein
VQALGTLACITVDRPSKGAHGGNAVRTDQRCWIGEFNGCTLMHSAAVVCSIPTVRGGDLRGGWDGPTDVDLACEPRPPPMEPGSGPD